MQATLDTVCPQSLETVSLPVESGVTGTADAPVEVHTSLEVLSELYNYNHWLFNKVRPFVGETVCEVGCGIGNITQFLLNRRHVAGIEPLAASLRQSMQRFRDHLNTRFFNGFLQDCPNEAVPAEAFDTVLCMNVLEHIEDDVGALHTMRVLCRSRGRVVILVPAHMSIYGELDRAFGHCRRYNRKTLATAFLKAGLVPIYSRYINTIGYFGWLWEGRCLGRRQINPRSARLFNRLVPFIDAFERLLPLPFGQSLLMVGQPETR
ncbi:MAG: class I SAM-dependent methyltransferase [Phycisphaerae bacterium]